MRCKAAVNIAGAGYTCELDAPHPGLAHANQGAQALWCSHGEARKHGATEKSSGQIQTPAVS